MSRTSRSQTRRAPREQGRPYAGVIGDTTVGVISDAVLPWAGDLRLARRSVLVVGVLTSVHPGRADAVREPARGGHHAFFFLECAARSCGPHGKLGLAGLASRTLLAKGLDHDHVIMANLNKMTDPCNLYVVLSQARKSITVLDTTSRVVLRAGN